ncbi:hypothetical protein [Pseudomonas sp. FME51]|uniref:hypothetical protein n=1 Tax=Pseudomonas sp. FME51 TaxID=2742609 RepID=UPI0018669993|nr:hypothetical protein [Pseudomonas sp. FME51]
MPLLPSISTYLLHTAPVPARDRIPPPFHFHPLPHMLADGGVLLSVSTSNKKRLMTLVPLKSTANVYNSVYNTQGFRKINTYKSGTYHA